MHRIEVLEADITSLRVNAIVNAANERMLGRGGVDGAIHRAAGPGLLAECRAVSEVRPGVRCPAGEARITAGHRLEASHVIHTVGPVFHGGDQGESALLASCYRQSLRLLREQGLVSIAFPAISCGVFGYPADAAARVAVASVREFLLAGPPASGLCGISNALFSSRTGDRWLRDCPPTAPASRSMHDAAEGAEATRATGTATPSPPHPLLSS